MTQRQPFDPSRIHVPASETVRQPVGPATVTPHAVNEMVRGALAKCIPDTLHVLGEIGDISRPHSGHIYFSLKDPQSELRCVMWRSAAAKLKFNLDPGMQVIATGGLEVYTPRGTYQLITRKLEPRGVGALELAFRQLKERLEREGLFDPRRKKALPKFPRRIALVTSPSGAAIRDILQTLARRFPAAEVLVFPVRVQGAEAAGEIAQAIRALNSHAHELGGIDVAIIGRGGGSLEDLWAFNEEVVARAIAAGNIPLVSAVGHEVDISISDLVADVRAATPTAAAELVAPRQMDLLETLLQRQSQLFRALSHALELARGRLDTLLGYDWLARPVIRLRQRAQLLDEWQLRLRKVSTDLMRRHRERLSCLEMSVLRYGAGADFARQGQVLEQRMARLRHANVQLTNRALRRHFDIMRRLQGCLPLARLARYDEHLCQMQRRTQAAGQQSLDSSKTLLQARLSAIEACHPRHILRRGYSVTRDARTRSVIKSLDQITDKMRLITELSDGEFRSTADDPRQPGLFD